MLTPLSCRRWSIIQEGEDGSEIAPQLIYAHEHFPTMEYGEYYAEAGLGWFNWTRRRTRCGGWGGCSAIPTWLPGGDRRPMTLGEASCSKLLRMPRAWVQLNRKVDDTPPWFKRSDIDRTKAVTEAGDQSRSGIPGLRGLLNFEAFWHFRDAVNSIRFPALATMTDWIQA